MSSKKNATAAATIFSKIYRDRAATAITFSKTCRHRHCGRGAAAPPWTSLLEIREIYKFSIPDLRVEYFTFSKLAQVILLSANSSSSVVT
jgi:hypothetical protein